MGIQYQPKILDMKNLALGSLPSLTLVALSSTATAAERPNIIIMYIDDMGIGDVGCYGGKFTPTPNIDQLAKDGIKFEQYYSSAPVSSASRCGFLTGCFPSTQGLTTFLGGHAHNRNCEQIDFLPAEAQSIARAFKNSGYATAHIGKWHLGGGRNIEAPQITEYGFDEYCSTYESPDPDPAITATSWIWSAQDSIKRWHRTEYFVDKCIDFIERNQDEPFFLNFWPDDMHTPWIPESMADEKANAWTKQDAFEPVLAELDSQIGRLIEALDKMGLSENTLIIFTSDNGPSPSFQSARAAYMRGTKNSLYEGGIRMPFIVKYPKKIEAGVVNEKSVLCAVDLYPSLCKIAGIKTEKGFEGDGDNYASTILGKSEKMRNGDLMWDFGRNENFNSPGDPYHKSPHLAIRRGDWKLLVNSDGSDAQLYNLIEDKNETTNVIEEHQKMANDMAKALCDWYANERHILPEN